MGSRSLRDEIVDEFPEGLNDELGIPGPVFWRAGEVGAGGDEGEPAVPEKGLDEGMRGDPDGEAFSKRDPGQGGPGGNGEDQGQGTGPEARR